MLQADDVRQNGLGAPFHVEEGACYLARGKSVESAYRLFQHLADEGIPGLCVSRIYPDRVRTKYGLLRVPVWWISQSPGDDHFDPTAVGSLASAIESFIDEHPSGSLILLDGIEFIMAHIGFAKTLFFVEHLNEYVMPRRATMLFPVNPECFEPVEFARLERFMEGIEEPELRDSLDTFDMNRSLLGGPRY
ncbi:MAG TPA: DUF835 domain-containing protein [Thermoplasmata archaeon]|nr:DUF835 domain-containing protein [Thermoplasmata archaeon]